MKKLVASILLLVYFVVSTGFVVSIHYCMDEINSVELGHVTDNECNDCGMMITGSDGCCKDEVKVMKMQADQVVAKLIKANFSLSLITTRYTSYLFIPLISERQHNVPVAHGPPLSEQDTYLQNRVFRI